MNTTMFFIFSHHNQFCKELVLLLYHDDTVDVGYNQQFDNTMNLVVHNNRELNFTIHYNANYVMVSFQ